jgi:GTP-dependent phosphoenolpyruvate carboxykinase
LTFICTSSKDDSGPTNNWLPPDEAKNKLRSYFSGSMKGRTMYVIPYLMGPAGSPYSRIQGLGDAAETPIGFLPTPGSIDTTGLSLNQSAMSKVLSFDKEGWLKESDEIEEFFVQFRNRIPPQIREDIADLKHKLSAQSNP